jgi:Dyp-type peroxidase family
MALNLNQTLSWTKALTAASADAAAELAMLNDLQGNILKGHGRHHTSNLFVAFDAGKKAAAKKFIASLSADVTSALDQLTKTQVYKASGIKGDTFVAFVLSASGYDALGESTAKPQGAAFNAGMKTRSLNDPKPSKWDAHFSKEVHAMILIGAATPAERNAERSAMVTRITATSGAVKLLNPVFGEDGDALINSDGNGIEHFGYVDGRSQPLALKEDLDEEDQKNGGISNWNPAIPLSQLLVPCPGGKLAASHGSYFVFRKLDQNVKGFKQREEKLAADLEKRHGLPAGSVGERAGGSVVGRFENGTPVSLFDEEQTPIPKGPIGVPNNFNFVSDTAGLKCPFAGHIRKSNPRNDTPDSKDHLMGRRGIPYGLRPNDGPNDGKITNKPTGNVGLLFMAYQSSLENQFEFTQKNWVNNPNFRIGSTGIDPIIGQPAGASGQKWPVEYGKTLSDGQAADDFSGFVTMRGGEYFFAPSLSYLKSLK